LFFLIVFFFPYFSLSTIDYEKFNIQKHSFTGFSIRNTRTSNLLYIRKEEEERIYDLEKKTFIRIINDNFPKCHIVSNCPLLMASINYDKYYYQYYYSFYFMYNLFHIKIFSFKM
jgi:hypothetical protein